MMPNFTDPDYQHSALILRMAGLIAKERLGELSGKEQDELYQWLAENEKNQAWKDQLNSEYISRLLASYEFYEADMENSLAVFHDQHFNEVPVVTIRRKNWIFGWRAAAAVVLPLVVAGIWFSINRHRATGPGATASVDVRPGRNTATLTLSNGNRVILDTGMTGQVLQKGSILARYEDGKVAYDATKPGAVEYNTLTTSRGGQYQLVLPDGTKVWLNAASSIRYPTAFTGKERHVELMGEAYFEVMGKKDQPFVVAVDGMDVKVLGTEFDIMAYGEEANKKTTLVQGAVKVESGNMQQLLKPEEQAIVGKDGGMSVASHVDVESVAAWKQGFFQFNHIDITTMMREIARWYDVDAIYRRDDLSGEYSGRVSRKLNLSELISLLEGNGVGHFKIEGRKLIVLP